MTDLNNITEHLSNLESDDASGFTFDVQPISGEVEVIKVTVEGREELPIYISQADTQILCIAYLFAEDEVKEDSKAELHTAMLVMNIPMPLSSFAKIDDQYVVFGALSVNSSLEDVVREIEMLSENTLEAIEAVREYLK